MNKELKEAVTSYLKQADVRTIMVSSDHQQKLNDLYYQVFGEQIDCTGCSKEINKALSNLNRSLTNSSFTIKPKIMSTFKLKKNARIHVRSLGIVLTEKNLTDNNATALLAENPKAKDAFETLPNGWEKLVEAKKDELADVHAARKAQKATKMAAKPAPKASSESNSSADAGKAGEGDQAAGASVNPPAKNAEKAAGTPKKSNGGKKK